MTARPTRSRLALLTALLSLVLTSCSDLPQRHSTESLSPRAARSDAPSLPPPERPPAELDVRLGQLRIDERPREHLRISLDGCEQAACELRFNFSLPMTDAESFAGAPHPNVVFHPLQDGTFRWLSPTVLAFTPDEGSLHWGQRAEVTIAEATPLAGRALALEKTWTRQLNVPYFQIAGKVAPWPVIPGEPRFVAFLNWRSGRVGRGALVLLYDQPVGIEDVENDFQVNGPDGTPLDFELLRPANRRQVTASDVETPYLVGLRLTEPPADGEAVTIFVDRGENEPQRWDLLVDTDFQLLENGLAAGERAPLQGTGHLRFSDPFEAALLEEALDVTPEPLSLHVTNAGENVARLRFELEPGTRYRMTIDPSFTDVLGNRLRGDVGTRFHSADLPPLVELPRLPTLAENGRPHVELRARNVESPLALLRRFESPASFVRALQAGRKKRCADLGAGGLRPQEIEAAPVPAELNVTETVEQHLDGGPGLFCVELRATGRGSRARGEIGDAALVQVSDLGVTTKVFDGSIFTWVTRLSDAGARGGVDVSVLTADGQRLGSGTTGGDGVVRVGVDGIFARAFQGPLFVVADDGGGDVAVARLDDTRLSQAWQFGLRGETEGRTLHAAVFTERGAYRPGETVHVKVLVVRGEVEDPTVPLKIEVHDPRGQQVVRRELALDSFGGANLEVKLKEQATVGEYSLRVQLGDRTTRRGFRVEEYRVPSFRVEVESPGPWKRGNETAALVDATYLHGGSLGGREVSFRVLRQPQAFRPKGFSRYVFALADAGPLAGTVVQGKERLDGQGRFVVAFTPDHPSAAGPMRYTVDATVTDVDRQAYAGRVSRLVHPGAFYVGVLPPPRQILTSGDELRVPIVALLPDGKPLSGVEVRAQLERIDHHTSARLGDGKSVQHLNRPVSVEVDQCLVTTSETAVSCPFALPRSGQYRVRAWAQDRDHQTVQSGFRFTVSGGTPAAWPRFDRDKIEILSDRPSYRPGDVARLIVQTPYENARGLLTVERGGVLEHRLFTIDGDTPALELPITEVYAPNVYVSVVLLRGRQHDLRDATGFETGAPSFKIGYAELRVEPVAQRLDVEVVAPETTQPGRTVEVKLRVRDHLGAPRAGQATVMVVDEAVLSLTGYRTPDPVSEIHAERVLGVRTGENRLELAHAKRSRREQIFPGGDGGKGALLSDFPDALRKLWKSTAYWNPSVPVGDDGTATVAVELPDNTTTYRVMAVVTDGESRTGSRERKLTVRKPLIVRAVVPRFVYPGDELRLEAQAFNGTKSAGDVEVTAELVGLFTRESGGSSPVIPGESVTFSFPVVVTARGGHARVRLAARMGVYVDAVEVEVPVLSPGTRRTLVASTTVRGEGSLAATLPAERLPGTARMEVVASTTPLTELKDAVGYLMRYPNGCIEQTTSTAYPLVVLGDLLPEIGVEVDPGELRKFSEAGIRRILSFQTPEGGLSYWPGSSEPHAFATAFGLTALIEGRKRGYDVPDEALAGMADYLEAALRRGNVTEQIPHGKMADGDTRAFFVMTLGRLGRPQPGYLATLWRKRGELSAFGLSFLAIAATETESDHPLTAPILAEVRRAAREEESEAWFEGRPKGGWSFDSPLRTHASALLAYASAKGSDEMSGKLLAGLLKRRRGGMWGNTQENVFGIMGVHALAGGPANGEAPRIDLTFGGRIVPESSLETVSRRVRRLSLVEDDLDLEEGQPAVRTVSLRNHGGSGVILTLRTQYEVPLTDENRRPRSDGFEIARTYETLDGEKLDGTIPLGSLVRVRLKVKSATKQNYVAIADRLPAGLEPLNTSLATTEKVSMGRMTPAVERSLTFLSYQEMRDSRVAFFVDEMPAGSYEYSYVARATTPGMFLRPAADVEAMYRPEVSGATAIDEVTVK